MKILLLEDNMKLNQTIVKRLSLKGYKVDAYLDGLEAYYAIDEGYACFILDINVPSLDGVKLLKRVREYYDEVPVIIISASVELDIIKEAYDFGCNDYLKKPFFIDELEIKIDKLCKVNDNFIYFDEECYFDFKSSLLSCYKKEQRVTKRETAFKSFFVA